MDPFSSQRADKKPVNAIVKQRAFRCWLIEFKRADEAFEQQAFGK